MASRFFSVLKTITLQAAGILAFSILVAIGVNFLHPEKLPLTSTEFPWKDQELVVTIDQARNWFETGSAVFLDSRSCSDYEKGHIKGAISAPYQNFDICFPVIMDNVAPDQTAVTYCDGATCSLAMDLALLLKDLGFTRVFVLENGWSVWNAHQLPIADGLDAAE